MLKKVVLPLALTVALILGVSVTVANAENNAIPPDTKITQAYLENFRESYKQEILEALKTETEFDIEEEIESIPVEDGNYLVTYDYLNRYLEQLKKEIIKELAQEGGLAVEQDYEEVSASEGEVILLYPDTEIIYRGGNAVAITSSEKEGEGIADLSASKELFSGMPLEYGHIYCPSATESRKAILVTGATAYFTIRGDYEIS